jgi:cytidine deaminase|uniref:Cytidine deaminase n=1 Tax=Desulfobacca acetoxidans TaxID=60893 RepID=A0A7V6DP29_9BACT
MNLAASEKARVLDSARKALLHAYAPYSGVKVGAAVLTGKGQVYSGGNVENASSGLTLCAERAAIAVAVAAEGPKMRIRALAVVSGQAGPFPPCGACRQVMYEFGPEALVLFQGEDGLTQASITELLPHAFRLSGQAFENH